MQMIEWQRAVTAFHIEVKIHSRLAPNVKPPIMCDIIPRARLILEELTETLLAIEHKNFVEAVDGVIDLTYVCLGSCDRWGVDVTDKLEQLASQQRLIPRVGEEGFLQYAPFSRQWILETGSKAVMTILAGDLNQAVEDIFKLMHALTFSADGWGVRLEPIFEEIHDNNMTKKGGVINAVGKLQKPKGWQPPKVAWQLMRQGLV